MATTIRPTETYYVHAHTLSYRAMTLRTWHCIVLQQEDWKEYLPPNLSEIECLWRVCSPEPDCVSVSITGTLSLDASRFYVSEVKSLTCSKPEKR